ncbi:U-box domain-containing protein 25 [Morus notabilis]|uniref:U-box domain-containing protein n=2 Tax=Morus notabilis TaxID=981085 RepID=W9QUC2_9ROSA|nr:U-box domain-containing protein 25 [Morus notabilis]
MKEAEMAVPHLFRCPITLDLFKDPVTLCTGQTYDRSSIEKWLAAGNLTCPVTMQPLHDPTMVPNHTLRHLIERWLQIGHHLDPEYLARIDSFDALKRSLERQDPAALEAKLQALESILVLSEESSSKSCLVQLGFLPLLLEQVFGRFDGDKSLSEENTKFIEQALFCVMKLLPFCELANLNVLQEESKLTAFLALFKNGTCLIKMKLCQLIEITSSSSETKELLSMLGKSRELLHEMIQFVQQNSESSDAGIKALWALSSPESNRQLLIKEGIVDGLISYVSRSERREKSLAALAMATLEKLLSVESAKEELISNPNGISTLVKKAFRVSDHEGSESAVGALMIVCYGSLLAREEAIEAGVLTQLLLLLQSQCNGRTKTMARMLLKLLRSKRIEDPNHV